MKNNLLFFTRRGKKILSLEINLNKHIYYFCDDEEKKPIENCNDFDSSFISNDLFDSILNALEKDSYFVEDDGAGNASHLLLEACKIKTNEEKRLSKDEVRLYIKNGFIGCDEKETRSVCNRIAEYGAEESNYFVADDILNIYRKYINREIPSKLFANYSYFLCYALGYNKIYKYDILNTMINEIEWGFDGLSFCESYEEIEDEDCFLLDPCFYSFIKSCDYRFSRITGKKYEKEIKIDGRYLIYIFHFEWDCFMYIIEDSKTKHFNHGHFHIDTYNFNLDYLYNFMERDEFYNLLEEHIDGHDGYKIDKKLSINSL